jgi:hypothetical protein
MVNSDMRQCWNNIEEHNPHFDGIDRYSLQLLQKREQHSSWSIANINIGMNWYHNRKDEDKFMGWDINTCMLSG